MKESVFLLSLPLPRARPCSAQRWPRGRPSACRPVVFSGGKKKKEEGKRREREVRGSQEQGVVEAPRCTAARRLLPSTDVNRSSCSSCVVGRTGPRSRGRALGDPTAPETRARLMLAPRADRTRQTWPGRARRRRESLSARHGGGGEKQKTGTAAKRKKKKLPPFRAPHRPRFCLRARLASVD